MLETFVIDGISVEIEVSSKKFSAELIEVTSFADSWSTYIHSGYRFLRIRGNAAGKCEINESFQIIGKSEGGLVLKSLGYPAKANNEDKIQNKKSITLGYHGEVVFLS